MEDTKELKEEVIMLRNIIRLMLNNLEVKVRENLKQKELLEIFSKLIKVEKVVGGNDSMSFSCEVINLKETNLSVFDFNKLKGYLNERQEVVYNVCKER